MKELKVGDTVYGIPYGNAKRDFKKGYLVGTITKIGRKYVYISFPRYSAKWAYKDVDRMVSRRPDFADTDDENASFRIFLNEETCNDFYTAVQNCHEVRRYFCGLSDETIVENTTPRGMKAIHALMEYVLETDSDKTLPELLLGAIKGTTAADQANILFGGLTEKIIWPAEAKEFLNGASEEYLARIKDACADEEAISAFVQTYIDTRMNHDSDSGAVNCGEAWSREECLMYALENCPALDKYR